MLEADIKQTYDGTDGTVLIATASSTVRGGSAIRLWRWKPSRKTSPGEMNSSGWNLLEFMWKVLMILVTCAYVIDLISHKIHRIPLIPRGCH
jgi:hypothetical protein